MHLVLDHDGHLPCYAVITEGKTSELKVAREFQFVPGTILVFDRGYVDYQWYQRLSDRGVFFVTRLRHDAHYRVLESRPIPQNRHILKDEIILLGSHYYRQTARYRRIEVWVEERQEVLVLLSNHLQSFDPEPGRPNSLAPGKRAVRAAPAVIIWRDGQACAALSGSGGRRITGYATS